LVWPGRGLRVRVAERARLPPRRRRERTCRGARGLARPATARARVLPCIWTYRGRSLERYLHFPAKLSKSGPDKSKRIVAEGRGGCGAVAAQGCVAAGEQICARLLAAAVDVNRTARHGRRTALHMACQAGHTAVVACLLAQPGIRPDVRDSKVGVGLPRMRATPPPPPLPSPMRPRRRTSAANVNARAAML
jgi:hypothetical protein